MKEENINPDDCIDIYKYLSMSNINIQADLKTLYHYLAEILSHLKNEPIDTIKIQMDKYRSEEIKFLRNSLPIYKPKPLNPES